MPKSIELGFIFYIYFVSTKPTALSSCVTVTSQVAHEQVFKFQDPQAYLQALPLITSSEKRALAKTTTVTEAGLPDIFRSLWPNLNQNVYFHEN